MNVASKLLSLAGLAVAAVLSGTILAAVVHAESHEAAEGAVKSGMDRGGYMAAIDTDSDGQISAAEAASAREQAFTKIDADGDGKISQEEFTANQHKQMQRRQEAMRKRMEEHRQNRAARMFDVQDSNDDGVISSEEFLSRGEKRFARVDRNEDGFISRDEIKRHGYGQRSGGHRRGGHHHGHDAKPGSMPGMMPHE